MCDSSIIVTASGRARSIHYIYTKMLSCLIYAALTLLLPLRLTFQALRNKDDQTQTRLWASYWAIYSLILFLRAHLDFLTYQPFELILLLLHLWLYTRGGSLLLTTLLIRKIQEFNLKPHVELIGERLAVLHLLESVKDEPKQTKVE